MQSCVSEDLEANLKKTAEMIEQAASQGAQIICLQELYRTRYFPQKEYRDFNDFYRFLRIHPRRIHRGFLGTGKKAQNRYRCASL